MRLYGLALVDIFILIASITLEGTLKTGGLLIGMAVGVLTILKLIQDIKIRKKENRIKELELIKKEQE